MAKKLIPVKIFECNGCGMRDLPQEPQTAAGMIAGQVWHGDCARCGAHRHWTVRAAEIAESDLRYLKRFADDPDGCLDVTGCT